ncbi:MAG: methyltransferase domain-containing protein [Planctomycetota bacterium]
MVRSRIQFLKEFVAHPSKVGAVAPSSRYLARTLIHDFDLANAKVVVEFGPGTGAFTKEIVRQIGEDTAFLAIELRETFVKQLEKRFPGLDVHHGSAEDAPQLLAARNLGPADYVLSGLPWASFPHDLQERLLHAAVEALRPGGRFATFAYTAAAWTPKARGFRSLLHHTFDQVEVSRTVWRNLPPAFVYHCTK